MCIFGSVLTFNKLVVMAKLKDVLGKIKLVIEDFGGIKAALASLRNFFTVIRDGLGVVVAIVMTVLLAIAVLTIAVLI